MLCTTDQSVSRCSQASSSCGTLCTIGQLLAPTVLKEVMCLQEQQTVYLDPAIHSLQRAASSFQTLGQVAGEAAGQAVGITPARMHAAATQLQQDAHGAAAQLQQDAHGAAVDGTKEVIRTIGIDSNTPGFGTPDSYYGEPSLAPGRMAPSHNKLLHTAQ